jgi:hypothetical protein
VPAQSTAIIEVSSSADVVLNAVHQPAWNCDSYCTFTRNANTSGAERLALFNTFAFPLRYYLFVANKNPGSMTYSLSVTLE